VPQLRNTGKALTAQYVCPALAFIKMLMFIFRDHSREIVCFTAVLFDHYTFNLTARAAAHRQNCVKGLVLG